MIGWAISIAIHIIVAFLFLTVTLQSPAENGSDRHVPQAYLAHNAAPLKLQPPTPLTLAQESSPLASPPSPVASTVFAIDTPPAQTDLPDSPESVSAEMPAAFEPQTIAAFCGSVNPGKYLAFMVDRSGSMVMAHDYVRHELQKSIEQLKPFQYYSIIYYAGDKPLCLAEGFLLRAAAANRQRGCDFAKSAGLVQVKSAVQAWQAVVAALEKAFSMTTPAGEKIELLYWLTDGEFDHPAVLDALERLQQQRSPAMTISVIGCGSRDNETFLQQIARLYNGTYRFVTDEEMIQTLSQP